MPARPGSLGAMDDQPEQPAQSAQFGGAGEDPTVAADEAPVRTGVARVDEVLAAVEELEERPIEEHVGVFETAHDELRRALDADPNPGPHPGPRPGAPIRSEGSPSAATPDDEPA